MTAGRRTGRPARFRGQERRRDLQPHQTRPRLIRGPHSRNPAEAEADPLPWYEAEAEADVRRREEEWPGEPLRNLLKWQSLPC
jgi:hypothetical protein